MGQAQTRQDSVATEVAVICTGYVGLALPVWYNPVLFNAAGLTIGLRYPSYLITSLEAHASATSAEIHDSFPNAANITDHSLGASLIWIGLPHFFTSVSLAYEHRRYWLSLVNQNPSERLLESKNLVSLGLGVGLRGDLNDDGWTYAVHVRHYPLLRESLFPTSVRAEESRTEIQLGMLLNLTY